MNAVSSGRLPAVQLEVFAGPLDLLWHLIERDQLDINDIPIAHVTEQYLAVLEARQWLDLELAGDFLVVAAQLLQLKLRALLPRPLSSPDAEPEGDPRQELVDRLLAYRACREAALALRELQTARALCYERPLALPEPAAPPVSGKASELAQLMQGLRARCAPAFTTISRDLVSVAARMRELLAVLRRKWNRGAGTVCFVDLVAGAPRREWVVSFVALLELARRRRVHVEQSEPLGSIEIHRCRPPAREVSA